MSKKNRGQELRDEVMADKELAQSALKTAVDLADKWEGFLILDTVKGIMHQAQIRNANHQRGGGGKRTAYEYEGIHYESGKALCDKLGIPVAGDSAPRKLERYIKDNPGVKISIIE